MNYLSCDDYTGAMVALLALIVDIVAALGDLSDWDTYDTYDQYGHRTNKKFADNFWDLDGNDTHISFHGHKQVKVSDKTTLELDKSCKPNKEKIEIIK